ncbi:hypothetical protein M758_3G099900 [Ceratodon purpureus]|nr:hypothetical protein M758_3G099900 [Ceratodon purpureus]
MGTPLKYRAKSPGHALLLTPNDDETERAQVRQARAAALRRKSGFGLNVGAALASAAAAEESNVLSREHILELHNNCIKLAAENKITQRNTWDLKLIDHLSALVQGDDDEDDTTNFQKASCTLEAGVKIYSTRVDSVHSETYKVLGGLNRTAGDDNGNVTAGDVDDDGNEVANNDEEHKKSTHKKSGNSSSTLETSFDSLNVKKFDVAFTVDPLFQQTSAQFDEGGAKGLLLNTLTVYHGCEIVFDSWEVPEKSMSVKTKNDSERHATINLSFMKDSIDAMLENIRKENEISPSLNEIVKMIADPYRAATVAEDAARQSSGSVEDEEPISPWQDGVAGEDDDNDADDVFNHVDSNDFQEGNYPDGGFDGMDDDFGMDPMPEPNPDMEDEEGLVGGEVEYTENGSVLSHSTVEWMSSSFGLIDKSNAWAGPDHWKYRNPKDGQRAQTEDENLGSTKVKRKKRQPFTLDFENPSEIDMSLFMPAENLQSTLLVQRGGAFNGLLPEDVHYEALNLVHLFLRPSVLCIWKRESQIADGQKQRGLSGNFAQDFGNDSGNEGGMDGFHGDWAGDDGDGDIEDPFGTDLVAAPRKIQKVDVNYDKTSKQVDVRILKESLWSRLQHIQAVIDVDEPEEDTTGIPFQNLLNVLPEDCAAAEREDISVQLCFICLLHLANEHNLRITDCPTMDDLQIYQVE